MFQLPDPILTAFKTILLLYLRGVCEMYCTWTDLDVDHSLIAGYAVLFVDTETWMIQLLER